YALGAILYVLLTGKPAFQGDTPLEVLDQVKNREPEPPRRINPHVDGDLETICRKCLEKEPARRYSSAEVLADDLGRWLKGEPIHARPVTRRERVLRWCRRNPLLAALSSTIAILVVAGVVGLIISLVLISGKEH